MSLSAESSPASEIRRSAQGWPEETWFWARYSWTDFARWRDVEKTVVLVPLAGCCDWGLGHPLDVEEVLGMAVLKAAAEGDDLGPEPVKWLVVPPLRFVCGAGAGSAFAATPTATYRLIEEVVGSVAAAGFSRIVLYNTSPWNEAVVDVVGRDLRIERGWQLFCVNLSGLGFDLLPGRSHTRRQAQTLATFLLGAEPEPVRRESAVGHASPSLLQADEIEPLRETAARLDEACVEGPRLLAEAGARLRGLLAEIAARPALADGGRIRRMTAAPAGGVTEVLG